MNNNSKENKYGHLLDDYMDDSKKYTHPLLEKEEKSKKEEGKNKYGDLLDNAKPGYSIYDQMVRVEEVGRKRRQEEAEKERKLQIKREERIEREKQEQQRHKDMNDKYVNAYLDKKKAEQEAIEKKKKEEAEKADFYMRVERLMNIDLSYCRNIY